MVMPRLMQRFSSRFHKRGSPMRSTSTRAGDRVDDRLVGEPGDDEPDQRPAKRERDQRWQQADGGDDTLADVGSFRSAAIISAKANADEEQEKGKTGEQKDRLQPVVPDVGLEAVGMASALPRRRAPRPLDRLELDLGRRLDRRPFALVELEELRCDR